ncbi:MAG: hypothetical protein QOI49_6 [Verrucomicrobiota bacterium]
MLLSVNPMRFKFVLASVFLFFGAFLAEAGGLQRIGHTTLTPRHSNPDDKGMYAALIDPVNGYAYFVGSYLFKLDITGPLPVPVGPALNTGQFASGAIDVAAGYAYFPGGTIRRFALGTGSNPITAAGSLALSVGATACLVIDDADPDPANHYAYILSTGTPARIVKIALSTFTELGSVTLASGEDKSLLASFADAKKGYAYFVTTSNTTGPSISRVVKVKMTPGANPPVRIGAVDLDTVPSFVDGGSIDTVHGYAYYGTYDSDPAVRAKVYKVKLEEGDVPPTLVGNTLLQPGEGRLAASVIDPLNGYVYFADDNSYPGHIYQLSLNGPNLPTEIALLPLQPGTSSSTPPNGTTIQNVSNDSNLPYGEVFFRSAVFDPVHGYAYFGQDSRPNQIVKVQVATRPQQLLNIATRARVQADPNALIGGFIVTGSAPKNVVIRALGPSLGSSGLANFLPDPVLELHDSTGHLLTSNDDWQQAANATAIPVSLQPAQSAESVILTSLAPGASYTAIVRGKGASSGIALVEVYDLNPDDGSILGNISTRGFVGAANDVMIGGVIVGDGTANSIVMVRALGPSLSQAGVANVLADPTLELHDGNGSTIASNDNWKTRSDGTSQQAEIEATKIPPSNDLESAVVMTLPAGNYTAILSGKTGATGVALIEAYNLQ